MTKAVMNIKIRHTILDPVWKYSNPGWKIIHKHLGSATLETNGGERGVAYLSSFAEYRQFVVSFPIVYSFSCTSQKLSF
jgi:hypothetical protein